MHQLGHGGPWYRQDYQKHPRHGHQPVTDPSFWFTMDGSDPGGKGVPFEHAEWELIVHMSRGVRSEYEEFKKYLPGRHAFGAGMIVFGTGMLIPGPFDAVAFGLGVAAFKHPLGGPAGVAIYNAAAFGVIGVGFLLTIS